MRLFALRKKLTTADHLQGITWYIACCFIAAVLTILYKYSTLQIGIFEIILFRGLFSLLFFMPLILQTEGKILKLHDPTKNIMLGIEGFVSIYFWMLGISMISVTEVTALKFITPVLVTILAVVMLKEKVSKRRWMAIAVCFIGMLFIAKSGIGSATNYIAYALIMVSALAQASGDIMVKNLTKNQVAGTIVIYNTILTIIISLPFVIFNCNLMTITSKELLILGAIGLLTNLFYLTKVKAFEKTYVSIVQPFEFSRLIFVAILSYLVFNEFIDFYTAIGGALIITGTFYEITSHRRRRRRELEKEKKIAIKSHV